MQEELDRLRQIAESEKDAHRHAVQQYVAEVELRSQLQAELASERGAKEHAIFLRSNAEDKNRQLQVHSIPSFLMQQPLHWLFTCACSGF